MRLRVTSTGLSGACQTRVVNAETGEPLKAVRSVRFEHADVNDVPVLTLELLDFDLDAEVLVGATVVTMPAPEPRLLIHWTPIESARPAAPEEVLASEGITSGLGVIVP